MMAYNVLITKNNGGWWMNLTTVALALLAFKLLSGKSAPSKAEQPKVDFGSFLNEDTQNLLSCVNKLQDKSLSQEDKTSAIFALITNPAVISILSNLSPNATPSSDANGNSPPPSEPTPSPAHQNDEGYTFETPSAEAEQAFEPIKNIAGVEVSHKLYSLYDNWYAKKH